MNRSLVATAMCILSAAGAVRAGELAPPPGPVAPTPGPEPRIAVNATNTPGDINDVFIISAPGSYYLAGNITVPSNFSGVHIAASDVVLDLNGFALIGPDDNTTAGVFADISQNITVRNGSVHDLQTGISLQNARGAMVSGVNAASCVGSGIIVGFYSSVEGCTATDNGAVGISAAFGGLITRCVAKGNANGGIFSSSPGITIADCTAAANTGPGFAVSGDRVTISRCTATSNSDSGIRIGDDSLVLECLSTDNTGPGIHILGFDNRIEGNNCTDNTIGIDADSGGNLIVRNSCAGNTTNWTLVANNIHGPIIDRTALASPSVNGNSAADSTATTHPLANFSY